MATNQVKDVQQEVELSAEKFREFCREMEKKGINLCQEMLKERFKDAHGIFDEAAKKRFASGQIDKMSIEDIADRSSITTPEQAQAQLHARSAQAQAQAQAHVRFSLFPAKHSAQTSSPPATPGKKPSGPTYSGS